MASAKSKSKKPRPKAKFKTAKPKTVKPKTAKPKTTKPRTATPGTPNPTAWPLVGVPSIDELLALWRRTREPRIADVLDAIAKVTPPRKPYRKPRQRTDDTKWRTWASTCTVADLPSLLAVTGVERLDVLDRFEPDPRIGRYLIRLIALYRPFSGSYTAVVVAMFERLAQHADVEVVERLDRIARMHPGNTGYTESSKWFDAEVVSVVKRLRAEVPAPKADPLIDRCDTWIAATRLPTTGIHDELFAAVYAEPDDDGPRTVLADALQQKRSPHGELIALQLAAATRRPTPAIRKRVTALVRKHASACCSPLLWKTLGAVTFERGFASVGRLAPRGEKDLRAAIGAVEWATVHTLDPGTFAGWGSFRDRAFTLELLTHPAMKHLRRVGPLGIEEAAILIEYGIPLPWRAIAIETRRDNEDRLPVLLKGGHVFSQLAHLVLRISREGFEILSRAEWLKGVTVSRAVRELKLADVLELPGRNDRS